MWGGIRKHAGASNPAFNTEDLKECRSFSRHGMFLVKRRWLVKNNVRQVSTFPISHFVVESEITDYAMDNKLFEEVQKLAHRRMTPVSDALTAHFTVVRTPSLSERRQKRP